MREYICKRIQVSDGVFSVERSETEIVRCRDCVHYCDRFEGCFNFGDQLKDDCALVEPDGFCAWGVRREND